MANSKQLFYTMPLPQTVSFFKEETYIRILNLPSQIPWVGHLVNLFVWPEIADYKLISTKEARSYEGFYLSGMTLIVTVSINIKISYTKGKNEQLIHVCSFDTIKNIEVILPKNVEHHSIRVAPYIEFSDVTKLDPKTLRHSGLLLVNVNLY